MSLDVTPAGILGTAQAAPVVLGDGTTPASRWRRRLRRAAFPVILVTTLAILAVVLTVRALPKPGAFTDLDPNNPSRHGSQALAEVLRAHGVSVDRVTRVADVEAKAGPGSTVVVVHSSDLSADALRRISATRADLVLIQPTDLDLRELAPTVRQTAAQGSSLRAVDAQCNVPEATRAGAITGGGVQYQRDDDSSEPVTTCFGTEPGTGAYVVTQVAGRDVRVIGTGEILHNAFITENGNAALAIGALGRHPRLVWLMADYADPANDVAASGRRSTVELIPDWFAPLMLLVTLTFVPLALWKGRRLGRLVREPLPVVVRSAETAQGRATLYRRVGATDRAATVLRAAALRRAASRLGLGRTASATEIVTAWAKAIGVPEVDVARVVLGAGAPPLSDERSLVHHASLLDDLERRLVASAPRSQPTKGRP